MPLVGLDDATTAEPGAKVTGRARPDAQQPVGRRRRMPGTVLRGVTDQPDHAQPPPQRDVAEPPAAGKSAGPGPDVPLGDRRDSLTDPVLAQARPASAPGSQAHTLRQATTQSLCRTSGARRRRTGPNLDGQHTST